MLSFVKENLWTQATRLTSLENLTERYLEPTPHLSEVLTKLRESGKQLLLVSNSPFWYVESTMRFVLGDDWKSQWNVIITDAGKPKFYTDKARPFREVCQESWRLKFNQVDHFKQGQIYTEGCIGELIRLMKWDHMITPHKSLEDVVISNVLYIGDSLFTDLVDAKREFGWITGFVTPEVGYEMEIQRQVEFVLAKQAIDIILNTLRHVQEKMGNGMRSEEDIKVLDHLEHLISKWQDRETSLMGSAFGSVFRARYQPSLFAHSLRRYADLYMTTAASLRHYSPQHRFYPEQSHLMLAHELPLLCSTGFTGDTESVSTNGTANIPNNV